MKRAREICLCCACALSYATCEKRLKRKTGLAQSADGTECRVLLVLLVLFLSCGFQSYFFIARHWLSSFFFGGGAGVIIARDKIIDPSTS